MTPTSVPHTPTTPEATTTAPKAETTTTAPKAETKPTTTAIEPVMTICQHKLESGPVTKVHAAKGAVILDVQLVDGAFVLRTVEDKMQPAAAPFEVHCYGVGQDVKGRLTHIPARASGVHFFVADRGLLPG